MAKKLSKRTRLIVIALAVVVVAVLGFRFYKAKKSALPEGIASGNGRVEAKLVDIAAREPLRVKRLLVDEGAIVKPKQVVAEMDTVTLRAQLAEAEASIAEAQQKVAVANTTIIKARSEMELARIEVDRSSRLVKQGAGSKRELDIRKKNVETSNAELQEAQATLKTAQEQVEVARANAAVIQTRIDDATLRSPVTGRVLYRLAEEGEVLSAGGKALTIVNLEDVYMEIFLPAEQAAALKVGSEARVTVDHMRDRTVEGYVSFVSPEAQFTPKQVETKSEREKLVFRVKIQLPKQLAAQHLDQLKTGVRGMGYVKVDPNAKWPDSLQRNLVTVQQPSQARR